MRDQVDHLGQRRNPVRRAVLPGFLFLMRTSENGREGGDIGDSLIWNNLSD